jgi:hypothetical protein
MASHRENASSRMNTWNLRLIFVFAGMTLISLAVSPFLFWIPKVLNCRTNTDPSTFLAYCNSNDFGDFEHGAFLWNLEPAAVKALQNARVLFLGNSRVQFAFSTTASEAYFREIKTPYYLAGFTYYENMVFAQKLIEKYKLHPRAVVINSDDTFFRNKLLSTPAAMLRPKTESLFWKTFYGYLLKDGYAHLARPLCETAPFLCGQTLQTLWRRRETGEWLWQETFANKNTFKPITPSSRAPAPDESDMLKIESAAETFFGTLALRHECIILTVIPNSVSTDEPIANRVGRKFGLPVILPRVDNLGTIDDSHLNGDSAERWSSAFLIDAAPTFERCLSN